MNGFASGVAESVAAPVRPSSRGYKADPPRIIDVLNEALAAELVCVLRYKQHHVTAGHIAAKEIAQEFLEHADEEQQHAEWIARRIVQLGGSPAFDAAGLATSYSEYDKQASLRGMIREDLIAEDIAIESYADIRRWLGNDDFTTRTLIESVLTMEVQHADDLRSLLATLQPAIVSSKMRGGSEA